MFYVVSKLLPKGLFKACVVQRPIAWVSTVDKVGHFNIAPFSYFNIVCEDPPMVMFSTTNAHADGGAKDSLKNAEDTGEFVVNIATYEQRDAVNLSSLELPRGESEFELASIEHEKSELVKAPRVKHAPIHLECAYHQSVQLPTSSSANINRMVIGRVLGVHVRPEILTDGLIDIEKMRPIARLGYNDYETSGNSRFTMMRPIITDFFSTPKLRPGLAAQQKTSDDLKARSM